MTVAALDLLTNRRDGTAVRFCGRGWPWCRRAFLLIALSVWASLSLTSHGRAEDDDDEVVAAERARQFVLTEQQFDQMVFGGPRQVVQPVQVVQGANNVQRVIVAEQPAEMDFRKRMEVAAASEIIAIDRTVSLSDVQRKKLELAARGDISQLMDQVADLRRKLTSRPLDQQEYVSLLNQLQPLRISPRPVSISQDSLFRKTLRHMLTDDQRLKYRSLECEWQSKMVNNVLMTLPNAEWGLKVEADKSIHQSRQANRQRFVDELLKHSKLPTAHNPYLNYIVFLEIGRLESQLKPLVVEETWTKLQTKIRDARELEQHLRQSGVWPQRRADDDDDVPAAAQKD